MSQTTKLLLYIQQGAHGPHSHSHSHSTLISTYFKCWYLSADLPMQMHLFFFLLEGRLGRRLVIQDAIVFCSPLSPFTFTYLLVGADT